MARNLNRWKYTPHHFPKKVEGHFFLGHKTVGTYVLNLNPAGPMTQAQLDRYGRKIAAAVNRGLKK